MTTATARRSIWPLYLTVSALLILRFLMAVLLTGGEWPRQLEALLQVAVDIGLLVGLVGMRRQLAAAMAPEDSRRPAATALFVAGLVSGVGLLLIRFTGDAAWRTGYLWN
jgi:hypothetical protein